MNKAWHFVVVLIGAFATVEAAHAATPAPAGIGSYSYVELRGIDRGSSRYFGSSAQGDGIKMSYQWTEHTFVTGEFDHLRFNGNRLHGNYDQAGINMGLEGTAGKVSAYLRAGFYRVVLSGTLNGARSHYWELAYGNRVALNQWLALDGEIYSDIHPEFGSRPYGLRIGASVTHDRASLEFFINHNPDVNSLQADLRFSF